MCGRQEKPEQDVIQFFIFKGLPNWKMPSHDLQQHLTTSQNGMNTQKRNKVGTDDKNGDEASSEPIKLRDRHG
jgi:hypothetical protein